MYNEILTKRRLYHTLQTAASITAWIPGINSVNFSSQYQNRAASLKAAIIKNCWDDGARLFRDNATNTKLHPQDANSMAILFGVVSAKSAESSSISSGLTKNWTPIGAETPELPGNISPFISSFEIQAHFLAGYPERALDLIRRCWGWYLNHPNGTQSTVIEGYRTDGSFGYRSERGYSNDPSYVSHAHGWSSGPTSALTEYLVGLSVIEPAGAKWQLKPNFGDLTWAQAGFTTSLGKYEAKWSMGNQTIKLEWNTPTGTAGYVQVSGNGTWVAGGNGSLVVPLP
jgi:hypothetical protein